MTETMSNPKLSVIVPIYGVEEYLEQCIESILAQTYTNLEVILVDDGSMGREAQICDKFAETDSRVKVIHKENGGLVAARKSGLNIATSPYVTFVDGDDYIAPDYYAQMMCWVSKESPDMVSVSYTAVLNPKVPSFYTKDYVGAGIPISS